MSLACLAFRLMLLSPLPLCVECVDCLPALLPVPLCVECEGRALVLLPIVALCVECVCVSVCLRCCLCHCAWSVRNVRLCCSR